LALLGQSLVTGQPIAVKTGRFGAYVTDGQVNATIPSGKDPARLSMDDALELIAAREAKMREQGLDPRPPPKGQKASSPKKGAPAKKAAPAAPKAPPVAKTAPAKKAAKKVAKKGPAKAAVVEVPAKAVTKKAPVAKAAKKATKKAPPKKKR
jgi:DNA topoisomerase-1